MTNERAIRSETATNASEADSAPDPMAFDHTPVMCDEVVEEARLAPAGVWLDLTLGGAGHAKAVLDARPDLRLVALDRDPVALRVAEARLASHADRVSLHQLRFDRLDEALDAAGVEVIAGFLFDLGVSSPQLDHAERGFSFRNDGPLDMRMGPDATRTAADVVNDSTHGELARILSRYGDERFAGRIASAIIAARPIETTGALAEIVVNAIPAAARRKGGHPAKRTFQAIRIEVNDELTILEPALEAATERLDVGGRGLVLTYHSGEDRIAKAVIRDRTADTTPVGLAVAADPEFVAHRPLGRRPSEQESERNPRARSARLRGVTRLSTTRAA